MNKQYIIHDLVEYEIFQTDDIEGWRDIVERNEAVIFDIINGWYMEGEFEWCNITIV